MVHLLCASPRTRHLTVFSHLFNKHPLSTNCTLLTVPDTWDTVVSKIDQVPARLTTLGDRYHCHPILRMRKLRLAMVT